MSCLLMRELGNELFHTPVAKASHIKSYGHMKENKLVTVISPIYFSLHNCTFYKNFI
jgi:hypothetical protein